MMHQSVWLIVWALCTFYELVSKSVDAQQETDQNSGELHVSIPLHDYDSEGRRSEPRIGVPDHVDVVEVRRSHGVPTMRAYKRNHEESDIFGYDERRLNDYDDSDRDVIPSYTKPIYHRPQRWKKRRHLNYRNHKRDWQTPVPHRTRKRRPTQPIPHEHVSEDFIQTRYKDEFLAKVEKFRKDLFEQVMKMMKSAGAPTARSLNSNSFDSEDVSSTSSLNHHPGTVERKTSKQDPVSETHSSPARRSLNNSRKNKKKEPPSTTSSTKTKNIVTVSPATGLGKIELSAIKPSDSSPNENSFRIHPRALEQTDINSLSMIKVIPPKQTIEINSTISKKVPAKEDSLKMTNFRLTSTKAPDLKTRFLVEKSPTEISLPSILQKENMPGKRTLSECPDICPVTPSMCHPCIRS